MENKKHKKKGSNKVYCTKKRKTYVSKIVELFRYTNFLAHATLGRFLHLFLSFFLATTRAVLVFALLGLFLVFFGRSVERYQKGRIATDQV